MAVINNSKLNPEQKAAVEHGEGPLLTIFRTKRVKLQDDSIDNG